MLTNDLTYGPYKLCTFTHEGPSCDEVTFSDLQTSQNYSKAGHAKICLCSEQVKKDRTEYFWSDTTNIQQGRSYRAPRGKYVHILRIP